MSKNNSNSKKQLYPTESIKPIIMTAKNKNTISQQNVLQFLQKLKDFKYQIDHEIAKCLDTLDRQGLKYLKETLRASKIFGFTQELGKTQNIEEEIQSEDHAGTSSSFTKLDLEKNHEQIKKISTNNNVDNRKKTSTGQKNNKKQEAGHNLGDKISKKLQKLDIKTGRKAKSSKKQKQKIEPNKEKVPDIKQQPHNEIIQQIQIDQNIDEPHAVEQFKSQPSKETNQQQPVKYFSEAQVYQMQKKNENEIKVQKLNQRLKPFYKKQFTKHHSNESHHQKDYGIQINQLPLEEGIKNQKQPIQDLEGTEQIKEQKREQLQQKRQQDYKEAQDSKEDKNEYNHQQDVEIFQSSLIQPAQQIKKTQNPFQTQIPLANSQHINDSQNQIQQLVLKINRLSPSKRQKLQKIIERLQNSKKEDPSISIISNQSKQTSQVHQKPYVKQIGSFVKHSGDKKERSRSRSRIQKQEKATSLKSSIIKSKVSFLSPEPLKSNENQNADIEVQIDKQNQNKQAIQLGSKQVINDSYKFQTNPSIQQSDGKRIKLTKKKTIAANTVFIKFLSNSGHSTLIGLNSIEIFNTKGQIVQIDETNFKNPSNKLIKLFSRDLNIKGEIEGWTCPLANASILVQNLTEQIGGVRIFNWNKSNSQMSIQADLLQLWVNDNLHWRGQIKGGPYREKQPYFTDIKLLNKQFQFPQMRNSLFIEENNKSNKREQAYWLEKTMMQEKIKELEEEQKKEEKKEKKNQNIRNSNIGLHHNHLNLEPTFQSPEFSQKNHFRKKQQPLIKNLNQVVNDFKALNENDSLGELGKSLKVKKKPTIVKEEVIISKKRQQKIKQQEQEQDLQFQKILQTLDDRVDKKPKPEIKIETKQEIKSISPIRGSEVKISKPAVDKDLEDFMKDSLFDDISKTKKNQMLRKDRPKEQIKEEYPKEREIEKKDKGKDLDNLIDELNDIIGGEEKSGQEFIIPQLPKGKELTLVLLSNWGHHSLIGINGIEIFDSNGYNVKPTGISSNDSNAKELYEKICKSQFLTSDETNQIKFSKKTKITVIFTIPDKIQVSLIRIWNYNGHRVHSNIGTKKCQIKLDGKYIFSGQIQQSTGSSEDAYKYCECVLFTNQNSILKKIQQKDWLNKIRQRQQQQKQLFKQTLTNFHRPPTQNDQQQQLKTPENITAVKLPKRLCFEYDPPQLPSGYTIKIILHSTWGDLHFIGLNGLQIFNEQGIQTTNNGLISIKADPSSISKLPGYERDKRVISNLINNKNNNTQDQNIWLAPYLSDVQKVERGKANLIIMQYQKPIILSGINFYNYTKTPARGVRQFQIFLDSALIYRGYLRKYDSQQGIIRTTINFTKQAYLLEKMSYMGYHEDNLEQNISFINEEKIIKSTNQVKDTGRPMTGKME